MWRPKDGMAEEYIIFVYSNTFYLNFLIIFQK